MNTPMLPLRLVTIAIISQENLLANDTRRSKLKNPLVCDALKQQTVQLHDATLDRQNCPGDLASQQWGFDRLARNKLNRSRECDVRLTRVKQSREQRPLIGVVKNMYIQESRARLNFTCE